MEALQHVLEWVQNLAFLLVGLWAFRRWRRHGNEQSSWLAATFASLALVVLIGAVSPQDTDTFVWQVVGRLTIAVLLPFPWLLLRFLDSFEPVPRWFRRAAGIAALLTTVVGVTLPGLTAPESEQGVAVLAFTIAVVVVWVVLLVYVAGRFWRAGTHQPRLVRRRLQTLSLGSASIGLALVGTAVEPAEGSVPSLVVQLVALAAATLFLVGFVPPRLLRVHWRQPEETQLHETSMQLMGATRPQEVADLLVPHMRTVIAARATTLVHEGDVIASSLATTEDLRAVRQGHPTDATTFEMSEGAVHVWVNAYTPFFGEEEHALLARLALLADLALDRTSLMARETAARNELQEANEELESFIYSASHDLKSPLIALHSYVDLLDTEYGDALDEEGRWYLQRMTTNCQFMEALVTDLLELSRVGRVETTTEVVDLRALVSDIAEEVEHRHPATQVEVLTLPRVRMNPVRARQLFHNLIENAAEHGGTDGVVVQVEARPAGDEPGAALVVVRDDGAGIPAKYHERVFGVFERLAADTDGESGTGIGLAICRKIATSIGGSISLTDHPDGAEFEIVFPAEIVADDGAVVPVGASEVEP